MSPDFCFSCSVEAQIVRIRKAYISLQCSRNTCRSDYWLPICFCKTKKTYGLQHFFRPDLKNQYPFFDFRLRGTLMPPKNKYSKRNMYITCQDPILNQKGYIHLIISKQEQFEHRILFFKSLRLSA